MSPSIEQSVISRETIQNAFFKNYAPLFYLDVKSSIKHPTAVAQHSHLYAVLLLSDFYNKFLTA